MSSMANSLCSMLLKGGTTADGLNQVKRYIEEAKKLNLSTPITWQMIEALSEAASTCMSRGKVDPESMDIILSTFLYIVRDNDKAETWKNHGFELGDLTLKILEGIENSDKFQPLFCNLLSTVKIICKHNTNIWRQVARPLLNMFINKKFDYNYLEGALVDFKSISKSASESEMIKFAKENLHLLRGFSMIVQKVGDFATQLDIFELIFLYTGTDKSLLKGFFTTWSVEADNLLKNIEFSHFEHDSRAILNAVNNSLGSQKKVFSINCNLVYLGNIPLRPPPGTDAIWLDVNRESRRMSVSCGEFLNNESGQGPQCVMLQLPLCEVTKLRLESGTLSDEDCYCITLKIDRLTQMYDFTKSRTMICTALNAKNKHESIMDFMKAAGELSGRVPRDRDDISDSCDSSIVDDKCTKPLQINDARKLSYMSPVKLKTGSNRNDSEKENVPTKKKMTLDWSSKTCNKSPNTHTKCERVSKKVESYPGVKTRGQHARSRVCSKEDPNLQVHHISSSALNTQKTNKKIDLSGGALPEEHLMTIETYRNSSTRVFGNRIMNTTKESPMNRLCTGPENGKESQSSAEGSEDRRGPSILKNTDSMPTVRRNYSLKIYEEWANSSEDLIETQEFIPPGDLKCKDNDLNHNECLKVQIERRKNNEVNLSNAKYANWSKKNDNWRLQNKNRSKKGKETENIVMTSLLDPEGYSYKRWKMPTTSERGNFWLNKLKTPQLTKLNSNSQKPQFPATDIFNFPDEDEESESGLFRTIKTSKCKKTGAKPNRSRKESKGSLVQQITNSRSRSTAGFLAGKNKNPAMKDTGTNTRSNSRRGRNLEKANGKNGMETTRVTEKAECDLFLDEPTLGKGVRVHDEVSKHVGQKEVQIESPPSVVGQQCRMYNNLIMGRDYSDDSSGFVGKEDENKFQPPFILSKTTPPSNQKQEYRTNKRQVSAYENSPRLHATQILRKTSGEINSSAIAIQVKELMGEVGWEKGQVEEIIQKVSVGMDKYLGNRRMRDAEMMADYMGEIGERVERWVDEQEEYAKRSIRMEKCAEYFTQGCTATDLNNIVRQGIAEWQKSLNTLSKEDVDFDRKISRFVERLGQLINTKTEDGIQRRVKDFKANIIELFYSITG